MIKIRVKERHPQLPKVVILCFVKKWQISNSNPRKWWGRKKKESVTQKAAFVQQNNHNAI
jgi:hypothetical protein